MQTDYERYIKMSSLAQIGWWEADFAAGHYLCSDFLCELLGLEGDTISFQDFQKLIREDYREQIIQEFRANANIHRNFYEQTFPVRSRSYSDAMIPSAARIAPCWSTTGVPTGDGISSEAPVSAASPLMPWIRRSCPGLLTYGPEDPYPEQEQ